MSTNAGKAPRKSGTRYRPAHGRDFDIAVRALDDYQTSRTRDRIGYIVLGASLGAIGIAAIRGFLTGNFSGLDDVWRIAGPIIGAVTGYYFHRGRKDPG